MNDNRSRTTKPASPRSSVGSLKRCNPDTRSNLMGEEELFVDVLKAAAAKEPEESVSTLAAYRHT